MTATSAERSKPDLAHGNQGGVEIIIDFSKSLEANASDYFERAKKARVKAERIKRAIQNTKRKLERESAKHEEKKEDRIFRKRKRAWFEKFHWFYSSDGFLVIGGRDAQSNEAIVKKHMEKEDVYFHADIQGAPHCIVKAEGRPVPETTKKEAAAFAGVFSKAWSTGIASVDVYSVKPEQVSKSAPSGESMGVGAFMIYGKRRWYKKQPMRIAIGIDEENRVISGPESAVKKHSSYSVTIVQGRHKKGEIAKAVRSFFERKNFGKGIHLDEFIAMIPAGGSEIKGNN